MERTHCRPSRPPPCFPCRLHPLRGLRRAGRELLRAHEALRLFRRRRDKVRHRCVVRLIREIRLEIFAHQAFQHAQREAGLKIIRRRHPVILVGDRGAREAGRSPLAAEVPVLYDLRRIGLAPLGVAARHQIHRHHGDLRAAAFVQCLALFDDRALRLIAEALRPVVHIEVLGRAGTAAGEGSGSP